MLLITGQRLREVAEMHWTEIDLDKALWTIPPERMKGDAAHEIPLPPVAVEILKESPALHGALRLYDNRRHAADRRLLENEIAD